MRPARSQRAARVSAAAVTPTRPEGDDLVLVGDIGGTNARLALAGPHGIEGEVAYLRTGGYPRLRDAVAAFLAERAPTARLRGAALCGAGPVMESESGSSIHMTNATWDISTEELREATGIERPVVMNDFAALARGVLLLGPTLLQRLGGDPDVPPRHGPVAVLGPGTGLGAAALVPDRGNGYLVLTSEGGHIDLAATDAREIRVLERLMARFEGHISTERVLSGAGLSNLYRALGEIAGVSDEETVDPPAILVRASTGQDGRAREAVELFTGWLGSYAGNLALTYGATGGVFVAGGVTPRLGPLFDTALFRRRFEAKGRLGVMLRPIPAWLVIGGEPALAGLAAEAFGSGDDRVHVPVAEGADHASPALPPGIQARPPTGLGTDGRS